MNAQQKREKRVALAKDVLAQLAAHKFVPDFGNYCRRLGDDCYVCATGAMLVACCGIPNGLIRWSLNEDDIVECLEDFFDVDELALIEAAFEARDDLPLAAMVEQYDARALKEASGFAPYETAPAGRLRLIMENIIDNGGEFRP